MMGDRHLGHRWYLGLTLCGLQLQHLTYLVKQPEDATCTGCQWGLVADAESRLSGMELVSATSARILKARFA